MEWLTFIIIEGAVVAFLVLIRMTLVWPDTAHEWLKKGAKVVDVRSEGQFKERHLPGAVSIPLHRLRDMKIRVAPNKEQPLLLHSLSGTRSGMGQVMLRNLGYPNVFNLGSYERAERILGAQNGNGNGNGTKRARR
jgi:rhodanese-related sulfurtransferase